MSKYRIESIEEQSNGNVNCDTRVFTGDGEDEKVIGHFTVVLDAADILAASGTLADRVTVYKSLFFSDPRIAKTIDSEAAVAKLRADVNFPVTVEIQYGRYYCTTQSNTRGQSVKLLAEQRDLDEAYQTSKTATLAKADSKDQEVAKDE